MNKALKIFGIILMVIVSLGISLYSYWQYRLFEVVQLKENIYLLRASAFGSPIGANVLAINSSEGWILVDTQLEHLTSPLKRELDSLKKQNIHSIINTHWHPDHTGGNSVLGVNSERYAHQNLNKWLEEPQNACCLTAPDSRHRFPANPKSALPNKLYRDKTSIEVGDVAINLMYPGSAHTGGDSIVEIPDAGIVHLGDILWPNALPFADTGHGGDLTRLIEILSHYAENSPKETLFISGHGEVLNLGEYRNYVDKVKQSMKQLKQLLIANDSIETLQNANISEPLNSLQTDLVPAWRWAEMLKNIQKN